ncbi:MAG: isochorismatase family protein [Acidimicrobiales bacterium]
MTKPFVPRYDNGGLVVAGARPHRWPAMGLARPAGTALLVVGAQRSIASQCAGASYVWETISALVAAMRPWGAKIAWARHARSPANASCPVLPPAHGPERGPAARRPGDLVALAYGVDGFSASPLAEGLRASGTVRLVIAGFGLEGPVHSTLRTASDRGWECLLVADACAPFQPDLAPGALGMVEMSGGLFGVTATAQGLLSALAAGAAHRGEQAV